MTDVTREFQRYWVGSYASFIHPRTGDRVPLLVEEAIGSPDSVHTVRGRHCYSPTKRAVTGDYTSVEKDFDQVLTDPPPLGVVNLRENKIATYITLRGARQWRYGLTRERLVWRTAMSESIPGFRRMFSSFFAATNSDLYDVFNPSYPPFQRVLETLANGEAFSQAFTPLCWASVNSKDDNILIGYKMWPVGTWENNRVNFFSHALPYQMAVMEAINDNHC